MLTPESPGLYVYKKGLCQKSLFLQNHQVLLDILFFNIFSVLFQYSLSFEFDNKTIDNFFWTFFYF